MYNEALAPIDLQYRFPYLMENDEEAFRLEQKTDFHTLRQQAEWAGLQQGMRLLDLGCGAGVTTNMLKYLVGPSGEAVGMDASAQRIRHARSHYSSPGISFIQKDIYSDLASLGTFDFIWVRFFLQYHPKWAEHIVKQLFTLLSEGGILCLIDLDNNCTGHYQMPWRMEKAISEILNSLVFYDDFDPYVGRKLYSYMYDTVLEDIDVHLSAHHLLFGHLQKNEVYNWTKKLEVAVSRCNYSFPDYENGFEQFKEEFLHFISDPRRFIYTPMISCRGKKKT